MRSLFLQRGHAYVYFVYGCWYALNVSGERPGIGAGVLLRALEPIMGIDTMRRLRGVDKEIPKTISVLAVRGRRT